MALDDWSDIWNWFKPLLFEHGPKVISGLFDALKPKLVKILPPELMKLIGADEGLAIEDYTKHTTLDPSIKTSIPGANVFTPGLEAWRSNPTSKEFSYDGVNYRYLCSYVAPYLYNYRKPTKFPSRTALAVAKS